MENHATASLLSFRSVSKQLVLVAHGAVQMTCFGAESESEHRRNTTNVWWDILRSSTVLVTKSILLICLGPGKAWHLFVLIPCRIGIALFYAENTTISYSLSFKIFSLCIIFKAHIWSDLSASIVILFPTWSLSLCIFLATFSAVSS